MADDVKVAPAGTAPAAAEMDEDTRKLHELGYAQVLDRRMSAFSNMAISFTIISILSGCLTGYQYGLLHGGPSMMNWAWIGVGIIVMFAGLSMAEICSAFPTAGGLYYWAARLAPGKSGPIWSWFTGWFNLLGEVAVTAGISFGCAYSVSAFIAEASGDAFWTKRWVIILILAIVLALQGLLNTFNVRLVALLNDVSVWWHLIGVAIIFIVLFWGPAETASRHSLSFMFGAEGWNTFKGLSGFAFPLYVVLLGMLHAQYTYTGYDASAHVSEETLQANRAAAKGIVQSIYLSLISGFILLVAVSYALPAKSTFAGATFGNLQDLAAGSYTPWANAFVASGGRALGLFLIFIVMIAQFLCGMSSITANSRMIFAFSRDGAVPGSKYWHHVSPKRRVPVRTAWFGAIGAFLVSFYYIWSPVAYFAVISIAVIGLYVAYLTPVFLRRINSKMFEQHKGPWQLPKGLSPIINWIAIIWVCIIVVVFCLPQYSPITLSTFNFTPVAVVAVIGFAGIWWAVSARKWFKGPKIEGTAEELAEIEKEMAVFDHLGEVGKEEPTHT